MAEPRVIEIPLGKGALFVLFLMSVIVLGGMGNG